MPSYSCFVFVLCIVVFKIISPLSTHTCNVLLRYVAKHFNGFDVLTIHTDTLRIDYGFSQRTEFALSSLVSAERPARSFGNRQPLFGRDVALQSLHRIVWLARKNDFIGQFDDTVRIAVAIAHCNRIVVQPVSICTFHYRRDPSERSERLELEKITSRPSAKSTRVCGDTTSLIKYNGRVRFHKRDNISGTRVRCVAVFA